MLTAWDKLQDRLLALPDYDTRDQLEDVREQARLGQLLCPTCRQLLWLRAGDVRTPHFGHRSLNDCPAATVSEAVLAARGQLYRFFRVRIDAGKLQAEIDLEPQFPALANVGQLDMLLRRAQKPAVAIWIVERSLKPDIRAALCLAAAREDFLFRPVFLSARLKPAPDASEAFLLDPSQRELQRSSPYDLQFKPIVTGGGTLHFIDAIGQRWTTLRGLSLRHEPQLFVPTAVRTSPMAELLWTEAHSEWVHPGEAEGLKAYREAEAEKVRRAEKAQLAPVLPARPVLPSAELAPPPAPQQLNPSEGSKREKTSRPESDEGETERLSLAWMTAGLACVGCGERTKLWQNASPGKDACVCRSCFARGVRLG